MAVSLLSDRTFRSKSVPPNFPSVPPKPPERPPMYKSYHADNLLRAYEEVKDGQLSIRRAAAQYNLH